jgi:hypothetical protein
MMQPKRLAAVGWALAILGVVACRHSSVTTTGEAGGAPTPCAASSACEPDAYCAFEPRLCGKGKRPGTCRPRPQDCSEPNSPVCGCDGKVYESACAAYRAGIDLDANGHCRERVPDWIACGPRFCDARTTYCEIILSDVFELPTTYACRALPPACMADGSAAPSCTCFPSGTRCSSFCGDVETGGLRGFHLTCRM